MIRCHSGPIAHDDETTGSCSRPDPGPGASSTQPFEALTAVLPVLAIIRGSVELSAHANVHDTRDAIAYALAFTGLLLGGIFFAYAVKYYLSTGIVLLSALLPAGRRRNGNGHDAIGAERQHSSGLIGISRGRGNGNGNGHGNGDGNGYHIDLGYHPFVSVHVAAYNEKRVIERL